MTSQNIYLVTFQISTNLEILWLYDGGFVRTSQIDPDFRFKNEN